MAAYSFLDVVVSISGPNGKFVMGGDGAANAAEGCTFAFKEEKNVQTVGADGSVMNSLRASQAGRVTIRLLKTSPVNALLSAMYNADRGTTAQWGLNTISLAQMSSGDVYNNNGCAFVRLPNNNYATEGGTLEWEFDVAQMVASLAAGIPGLTA